VTGVEDTLVSTLDFAGKAACTVARAETQQQGSEAQLGPASAGCGVVCQDAPVESIVGSPDMFRIDPSFEGGQQSAEC